MTKWTGTLKTEDGASAQVTLEFSVLPPVEDPPTGVTFPDKANTVWIGTASYPLAAIDPPTIDKNKPGGRDTDQVIVVTKATTPQRNPYGFEIGVKDGKVVASGPNLPLTIISPSLVLDYILSGHGKGETFVRGAAIGAVVRVTKEAVPPPVVVPPATTFGAIMAVYLMIGTGKVSQLNGRCRRAIVAFFQGTDLVNWNGGQAELNGLTAWCAKGGGRDVLISLGGQGGNVVLDQVDEGIERINRTRFPVKGIDFDAEAFSYTPEQALAVCEATRARLGMTKAQFVVQITPPGGPPVDRAIAVAKYLLAAGYVQVYVMHQLYDTDITDAAVLSSVRHVATELDKVVGAGRGQEHVIVGIMIGDSHGSWTVGSANRRMKQVKAEFPRIGGAGLWESSRDGTPEVIEGVGATLGIEAMS